MERAKKVEDFQKNPGYNTPRPRFKGKGGRSGEGKEREGIEEGEEGEKNIRIAHPPVSV